jgi:hypothetical protein
MKFFCELQSLCRALNPERNVRPWADFCEGQTISCPIPLTDLIEGMWLFGAVAGFAEQKN